MRPAALYPDNILEIIENPWIFIILIIINFYVIQWDLTIGLLMFLSIIALLLDIIIFTEGKIFFNKEEAENYSNNTGNTGNKSSDTKLALSEKSSSIIYKSYMDINDIIMDNIKKYKDINYNKKSSINVYI